MQRGHATGAILDNEDDRWTAQGLLDYWSSVLYRAGQVEPPDATLMEFDAALAPDLDDELCPYLGLEAFRAENQHLFFGRQRLLDRLLKHLATHRFLVVVGSSGSGKSSVVLGGVLPRLVAGALPGSEEWVYYAPLVPGSQPLAALARRLKPAQVETADWVPQQVKAFQADPFHLLKLVTSAENEGAERTESTGRQPVVLFIDQFEEVFTLCRDEEVRLALVQNLINFVQDKQTQNRLILTMRTDFESQFVRIPELLELFEASHIRTMALEATELREAITKPAALVGLKFEEGLVDELLGDVLGEPAALPLLQFTLLKLWDHRERNRVTWEAYRRLGGGRLALAKSADEFYRGLIPEEQVTMRRILLRMVRPGEGLEVTSRRIPQSALYQSGEAKDRVERVLDKLIQARLVRLTEGQQPGDAQVEVAHEALIRNWPQLVDWLEDERVALRQRLRLSAAAEQWQTKKRDSSTLLRGVLLAEARGYEDLSELERDFIRAGVRAERRSRNVLWLMGTAVVMSLSATSVFALMQARQARRQTAVVEILEAAARSKNWVTTTNATLGLALAISATDRSQQIGAEATVPTISGSLLNGLQTAQEQNLLQGHTDGVLSVAISPDGERIVSSSADKTVRIWNAETGEPIGQPLQGHTDRVLSVAISPDGERIVSSSADRTVRIWDAETGEPIGQPLQGHTDRVLSVAISPDGEHVVSSSADRTVRIWDAETGEPIGQPLQGHTDRVLSVAISPDGEHVVSSSADRTVRIWDAETGEPIGQPLQGHTDRVLSVAISPDDERIVSSSADRTVRIWDMDTGEPIGQPLSHTGRVFSVAMSRDGQRIVSSSDDKTVRIWDAATGKPIGQPLRGHTGRVLSVAVSLDSQRIVSGSGGDENTVRIWDMAIGEPTGQPLQPPTYKRILSVAVNPDGKRIISGSSDNVIRIWDIDTNEPIGQLLKGHMGWVSSVAVSPDGKRIISGSYDNTVRIWRTATGEPVGQPLLHVSQVSAVAISPDGRRIISGSHDNTVRIWDVETGEPVGQPLEGHTSSVNSVAVSPDGRRIISGSHDNTVRIWDVETGEPIGQPLKGHTSSVNSVVTSPNGQYIASGSNDRTIRIWDVETGEPIGQPLEGHASSVNSVAVSPDSHRIVSASGGSGEGGHSSENDDTVRIWDATTGELIGQPLKGHVGHVYAVAISPNGQHIISGGLNGTVRIWEGSWHEWMRLACKRLAYHPLLTAPETLPFLDDEAITIGRDAKAACDARPWLQSIPSKPGAS